MRRFVKQFLELESASGIVLFVMALVAIFWANSPIAFLHQRFVDTFIFFINEGLMAIFFLVVGLELKHGFAQGQLTKLSQVMLPGVAAVGGMLVPAVVYWLINRGDPIAARGWATPVATDIAFAVGVLTLFGRRVPTDIKLFLLTLAVFDDIGSILIIALFYGHQISIFWTILSVVFTLVLYGFNRINVQNLIPYLFVGICLWYVLLKAGVHPTIAGVILALMLPDDRSYVSPLKRLEKILHPFVAFVVIPLFALANAGLALRDITFSSFSSTIVLGIALGLFIGKQLGVFWVTWGLIKLGWVEMTQKPVWLQYYGVSLLCGIGFTMSLFLGTLSFEKVPNSHTYLAEVRLGVIVGSLVSGVCGAIVLLFAFGRKDRSSIVG